MPYWGLNMVYWATRRGCAWRTDHSASAGADGKRFFTVPVGLAEGGTELFSGAVLRSFCARGGLERAPYSLEIITMPRLPAKTVGVLMSLDPAVAAIFGLLLLGGHLNVLQWAAIGTIMVASAGSAPLAVEGAT